MAPDVTELPIGAARGFLDVRLPLPTERGAVWLGVLGIDVLLWALIYLSISFFRG